MGRRPNPKIRERIIQEAEHLIHLRGYHYTSMKDIAKNCEMTKANLFHHFGTKEDLGLAVLDLKLEESRTRRIEPLCEHADPVSAVEDMFSEAQRFFNGNGCKAGCFIGNIALEMSDVNEPFRRRVGLFFQEWSRGMADCLKCSQKAGYFGPDLDPRAAAESIVACYEGAIMMARTCRDASILKRVGKAVRSILEQHRTSKRRKTTMGPKTPCGC